MAKVAAFLLGVVGLLPIANWIAGGHEAPWYADRLDGWTSGGAIVVGIAVVAAILLKSRPALWPEGKWGRVAERWANAGRRADTGIAAVAFLLYAVIAWTILSASPLLIDEIIQVYQARILATGQLWVPAPAFPEFSAAMHLIDWGGKVYGQFPVGGPAMLALGSLVHAEWVVGPLFAALGVFAWARIVRRIEVRRGVALAAVVLYAFAPFTAFLSGSMMNHVTTLTWLLLGTWALAVATEAAASHWRITLAMGLAFGVAATIRPLDAAAFAVPAGMWLLWRARSGRDNQIALAASGVGILIPLVVLGFVNHAQTGDPFRFGYIEMWGASHELGFHAAPWGFPHTPARGVELINLYLLRLQTYFFETPVPSLLFATGALALTRQLRAIDRWALLGCGAVLLAYWAYWHDGFYLGPRFLLPLAPWIALWTARFPAELVARDVAVPVRRGVLVGGVAALLIGGVVLLPLRAQQYRNGMLSMRFDVDAMATAAGVASGDLVLVRESWGAQVVARMWGLGVSRVAAEQFYRTTDLCRLDEAVGEIETRGGGAAALAEVVAPWQADSNRLVALSFSPDTTGRVLPGSTLSAACTRRVIEDQAGFTVMAPFLLTRGGPRFVRDLHARDSLVLGGLPTPRIWLATQGAEVGAALRFAPIQLDSARAEWRSGGTVQ